MSLDFARTRTAALVLVEALEGVAVAVEENAAQAFVDVSQGSVVGSRQALAAAMEAEGRGFVAAGSPVALDLWRRFTGLADELCHRP